MINQNNFTNDDFAVIESALQAYWFSAVTELECGYKFSFDGTKLPLGDVEKQLLKERVELTKTLLKKFQ